MADAADRSGPGGPGARWLSAAARTLAEVALPWELQVGPPGEDRSYELLVRSRALEVWLIHWPCGGRLQLHDHGGASGAFRVISGTLNETYVDSRCRLAQRRLGPGQGLAFGAGYVHDVANTEDPGATSIHVYAPPSDVMFFYRYDGPGQLVRVGSAPFEETEDESSTKIRGFTVISVRSLMEMSRIDVYLEEVRRHLRRVDAAEAEAIVAAGGLLVDTRPSELRRRDGEVPGALIIDRNVLEWRLDPSSLYRHPALGSEDQDRAVVLFCDEGYASSLAAASLQAIGLRRATDLIGGFQAWRAAGRPVAKLPVAERTAEAGG